MNENKIKNEKELKDKKFNCVYQKNPKTIDLNLLDKTPISKLLTFSAKELFQIQEQASIEFEKANYRKKWIEGVIELKYKTTIESAYKKAIDYFNSEPLVELDKYNKDNLTEYIEDNGLIIKVEFYRSISDITDRPQVKKRFTLLISHQVKNQKTSNQKGTDQKANNYSVTNNQQIKR